LNDSTNVWPSFFYSYSVNKSIGRAHRSQGAITSRDVLTNLSLFHIQNYSWKANAVRKMGKQDKRAKITEKCMPPL
jgi:hypothetical protein